MPPWGYNGNARRCWDFLYDGKLPRIERQVHHHGSGMNAIPLLAGYRPHPDDLYLLRVGYGGTMGTLTNLDPDGAPSAAFHSFPSSLKWDASSGDYGPNFFGHAWNAGAYLADTPDFGFQGFGGEVGIAPATPSGRASRSRRAPNRPVCGSKDPIVRRGRTRSTSAPIPCRSRRGARPWN